MPSRSRWRLAIAAAHALAPTPAAVEATEEAVLNSRFAAETMEGHNGTRIEALPAEEVVRLYHDANRPPPQTR